MHFQLRPRYFFIFALAVYLLSGCGPKQESNVSTPSEAGTAEEAPISISKEEEQPTSEKPELAGPTLLERTIRNDAVLLQMVLELQDASRNPEKLKTEEELLVTLDLRDSLMILLEQNEQFYATMEQIYEMDYQKADTLMNELEAIGMNTVSAEGMYMGLSTAPFLTDRIDQIASEPFRLKQQIESAHGMSQGSEYPYDNLTQDGILVNTYETLKTKYPDHPYTAELYDQFKDALQSFVDVHLVGEGEHPYPVCFDFNIDHYPYATSLENQKEYIESFPKSRFSPVFQKILDSPSQLTREAKEVHLIMLPSPNPDSTQMEMLWNGKDVAHVIHFRSENYGRTDSTGLAVRYFHDLSRAQAYWDEVHVTYPKSSLVTVSVPYQTN